MTINYKLRWVFLALFSLVLTITQAQTGNDSRILLQGFYWESHGAQPGGWYNYVSSKAQELQTAGIDMIWLPPPSDAASNEGYLPRQLNNLTNKYGTTADHLAMLSNLNSKGIQPIADIVINHRVGSTNWVDFTNPTWNTTSITADDEVWGQAAYQGLPRGNSDTGTGYSAARDIDHTNATVRADIKTWLNNLKNAGYKGWRYDFVHGFAPSYINEYNTASSPVFSVGEDWTDKQSIQNWINGTANKSAAFDFPTYYALKNAIKNGNYGALAFNENGTMKPSGLIGWSPAQSVTFVENHDTPTYDAGNNILNGSNVGQAYAYLLTHPGTPTIYWPHYFDWGVKNELNTLIAIRKNNGIKNTSSLTVITSSGNLYVGLIDSKVAVKIGSGNWSPSSAGWSDAASYILSASGNNYAIWVKSSSNAAPVVSVNPAGPYTSSSAFNVTITATDDSGVTPTIYYTLDGTEPTTSSASSTSGTAVVNISSSKTLKVKAIDNTGLSSATQTHQYTIGTITGFTVYWKKPNNGGTARIYYWNTLPAGAIATTTWPGATMADASSSYGAGWYKFTFNGVSSTSLILNNGQGSQTADLTANANAWYDGGWVSEPTDTQAPTVTVSPGSGNYSGSVNVTITATDNVTSSPTINYTVNGVAGTANGSKTLTFSAATTLVVSATDAAGNTSASQTLNYTFNQTSGLVIHYKGTFTNPYLYYWGATPNGGASAAWPGSAMTSEGDGWYKFTIPNATCSNLIFSNNGASQTANLNRCNEGWYTNGTWYNSKPATPTGLTIHFMKPASWSTARMHYWNVTATPAVPASTWPGVQMTNNGNGWWSYTIPGATCANIVFNNNGSPQTSDLYRCGEGWYNNGWSSSAPRLGTGEAITDQQITIYPNPVRDDRVSVRLSLENSQDLGIKLFDLSGKVVLENTTELQEGDHLLFFNTSDLRNGVYIMQFNTEAQTIKKQLVIAR